MKVTHRAPWLIADLGAPHRVLSWALNRPGFVTARRIVFREVRNRDLPVEVDATAWLQAELATAGLADAPALLTSRSVASFAQTRADIERVTVHCLATVGLSNSERVGHRQRFDPARFGTINIALSCSAGLTEAAQIEAMTIAASARTAAIIEAGFDLPEGRATGTGTDCIALAAPPGDLPFAGLHTDIGEALGRATYDAVDAAAADWLTTRPDLLGDGP
ncbi:Adenosylcobinamide amidohydrolase [Rhodovulum sp. P5]|uniref:adenosylcobinamide amidohydrolase n=1 Tax=Rhodovulum sp. P5 TaxID=1564506 RepID=UPI0009C22FB1|nr:adenosylcobinamide amidohydrolase [Rhodovulum sp. P5]ARE39828.1 Adenosylcobinamide amidohydrolase [Rhodovulum sp. P5]